MKVAQELAETLRDYFLTGAVRNAVNLPALDAEQFKELEPYLILCEKLGMFVTQLAEGATKELKIEYAGEISLKNTTPLTLAVLKGFLTRFSAAK